MTDASPHTSIEPDHRSATGLDAPTAEALLRALGMIADLAASDEVSLRCDRPVWILSSPEGPSATFETSARGHRSLTRLTLVDDEVATFETSLTWTEHCDVEAPGEDGLDQVLPRVLAAIAFWRRQIEASVGLSAKDGLGDDLATAATAIAAVTRDRARAAGATHLQIEPHMPWGRPCMRMFGPTMTIRPMDEAWLEGHAFRVPTRIDLCANRPDNGLHVELQRSGLRIDYDSFDALEGMRAIRRASS